MSNFVSLESILSKDAAELTALKAGVFSTERLGEVPFSALDYNEYKQAKKDCVKMVPDETGGMVPDVDDDKLMLKVVMLAVDKDTRSNFTFANADLLKKLGVATAEGAASRLLQPGEIVAMAMEVQRISGFGKKAAKEREEAVKN